MAVTKKQRYRFQRQLSRWTLPMETILDFLSRTSKHMSAKQIHVCLLENYPGMGLSTIYRTLDILSKTGFINKIDIGYGHSYYEYKSEEKKAHHNHLICKECGKIIDYSDFINEEMKLVNQAKKNIEEKYNFIVQDHNIEFYGLCEDCQ
jgi:Fur family ferric uptake transcriptional regulator